MILAIFWATSLPGLLSADVDWGAYKPVGYVSDYAGILSDKERTGLESLLSEVNTQYGVQLAVVSVKNLQRYDIGEIAKFFYSDWGVGRNTQNQSALLLVSREEGELHLYVGIGLRGVLTNRWVKGLEGRLAELIANQKYDAATVASVTAMVQRVHTHSKDLPARNIHVAQEPKAAAWGTSSAGVEGVQGGKSLGLPIAAIAAIGFGGLLLLSTFIRANKQDEDGSVYKMGRDFERNRTGAFGNKKPRWL